ncbi:non-homologous end joining protein Ku [Streptomyces boluensis]|uniref:Non-homologous end joining protein Ku n=1 Tax=Streptomyces boluensis TaxID=1775135 RepID=A0A964UL50_9ACTN|nr:Ku protein [Streptomyces boluensis]NBE51209.1 Ku protein [Streptomyces boluensis]
MRSIWNGAISFGLVSIPIKLVNATENHSISFRQIHTTDGGRIRYRKVCELEEKEVTTAEIGKGYEDADGSIIPITEDDLAALPIPTAKTIEIVAFVPQERIDPLQMDAAYYLAANGVPAAKPYTLLREALKRSKKVAIAKYALRGRERLGMLRVVDDAIAMHGLLWPDEIRAPEEVAPDTHVTVREAELDLADALMETLGEVDLETLHDDYREAVEEMVSAKVEGTAPAKAPEAAPGGGKVIDLMAALESSVKAAQAARGEDEEPARVTPLRRTSKSARSSPKAVGGKKSTAAGAKKKTTSAKKSTSTATKKTATSKKSTATKKTTTKKSASSSSSSSTPRKKASA